MLCIYTIAGTACSDVEADSGKVTDLTKFMYIAVALYIVIIILGDCTIREYHFVTQHEKTGLYVYAKCTYQTHGSVSAAKKNKKTGKNRTPHTSVLFTRTMI